MSDIDITAEEVLADLQVGHAAPLTVPAPLAPRRPVLGGSAMRSTVLAARAAVDLRLPLAGSLLERLWFTPWAASAPRPRPDGAHAFDVVHDDAVLSGWQVGQGPTVLLVHGWGGLSTDLGRVATHLAEAGHRVVAVDLPGHGASPGTMVDLFQLADAVAAAAVRAGPLAGIVAHSLGSVAALLAVSEGVDVPRVALLAPPATLGAAVNRMVERIGLSDRGADVLRRRVERRYGEDVWDLLDVTTTAPRVDADVLVLHDVDDREVPVGEGVRVARAFGTDPVLTTGLGHGRILVDDEVVARVRDHVAVPLTLR